MKPIDFKEAKAKKEGNYTPKRLAEDLLKAIEDGKIEKLCYVIKSKEGDLEVGWSEMLTTEAIGYLEVGKQYIMDDMRK